MVKELHGASYYMGKLDAGCPSLKTLWAADFNIAGHCPAVSTTSFSSSKLHWSQMLSTVAAPHKIRLHIFEEAHKSFSATSSQQSLLCAVIIPLGRGLAEAVREGKLEGTLHSPQSYLFPQSSASHHISDLSFYHVSTFSAAGLHHLVGQFL